VADQRSGFWFRYTFSPRWYGDTWVSSGQRRVKKTLGICETAIVARISLPSAPPTSPPLLH